MLLDVVKVAINQKQNESSGMAPNSPHALDLILRGGRVIDPSQDIDGVRDVGFANGTVAAIADHLEGNDQTEIRDVAGKIVTPGLIDLHTHVYWGGTSLGIDADEFCRTSAVTTSVDTGSAGPGNFAGFRKHVIEPSESRILAYLHVSFAGIFAFSSSVMVGESEDLRMMAPAEAARVADENRDVIVGIKARVGRRTSGINGATPLKYALEVADQVGMPVMLHVDDPPPAYEDVLDMLRPGDVLTHCFRPFPNAPVQAQGVIKPGVLRARDRGVIFDIGHGKGSLSFKVARQMLAGGFYPDTISSDIHQLCINGPVFDQLTTLSKFLCLGMSLNDTIKASTINAAHALNRPDLGTLKPGAVGDASILSLHEGTFEYEDVVGDILHGQQKLAAEAVVLGGRWWHERPANS